MTFGVAIWHVLSDMYSVYVYLAASGFIILLLLINFSIFILVGLVDLFSFIW